MDLTAAKRRILFRDMFRERLTQEGFVWKKDRFIRIEEELMLQVGIRMMLGASYLCWGEYPYCSGLKESIFRIEPQGGQIEVYIARYYNCDFYTFIHTSSIEQLKMNYEAFFGMVFDRLNAVHDMRSDIEYLRSIGYDVDPKTTNIGNRLFWSCFIIKEYALAKAYLLRYMETLRIYNENYSLQDIECLNKCKELLRGIETGCYKTIQEEVDQRVKESRCICRTFLNS